MLGRGSHRSAIRDVPASLCAAVCARSAAPSDRFIAGRRGVRASLRAHARFQALSVRRPRSSGVVAAARMGGGARALALRSSPCAADASRTALLQLYRLAGSALACRLRASGAKAPALHQVCTTLFVVVDAAAAFAAKPAGADELLHERTRAVLLTQRGMQMLQYLEPSVKADEIHHFERPHRMVEAELKGFVDIAR